MPSRTKELEACDYGISGYSLLSGTDDTGRGWGNRVLHCALQVWLIQGIFIFYLSREVFMKSTTSMPVTSDCFDAAQVNATQTQPQNAPVVQRQCTKSEKTVSADDRDAPFILATAAVTLHQMNVYGTLYDRMLMWYAVRTPETVDSSGRWEAQFIVFMDSFAIPTIVYIVGSLFLCTSSGVQDLLLNSLGLVFINDVDDMVLKYSSQFLPLFQGVMIPVPDVLQGDERDFSKFYVRLAENSLYYPALWLIPNALVVAFGLHVLRL